MSALQRYAVQANQNRRAETRYLRKRVHALEEQYQDLLRKYKDLAAQADCLAQCLEVVMREAEIESERSDD